jgi:hypothetical protein
MAKQVKSVDVIEQNIFANTIKSADELINKLTALNNEFKQVAETTKEVIKASKFDSVKSLNDFTKATENATKLQKEQLKVQNELNKALELKAKIEVQIEKNALQSEKVETEKLKRTIIQTKETERLNKATEREAKSQTMLSSAYARVNKMLNGLRSEYRDLAIKKELGAKLTDKEEFRYSVLEKRIQTYDAALKKVDASMGMHQRNVGNYKSGFDGLGMSINQLSREMPAFANSVQTGFMAISNNLPMLFDELNKIKKANVELKSQGLETKSMLSQLGKAVFSWGTALSVGVTLLTLFGAKMIDWVANALSPANEELEKQNKIRQQQIKAQKEQSDYISKESSMYVGLVLALKQTNYSSKERSELIKNINEQYGTTLKNIKDESLFQDQLNNSIREYLLYKEAEYKLKKNDELLQMNLSKQEKIIYELTTQTNDALLTRYKSGLITQKEYNKAKYLELTNNKELIKQAKENKINLAQQGTTQYELIQQLIELSVRAEKYGLNIGNLSLKTSDFNKSNDKNAKTQKDVNEYASKYLEIVAKIIALEEQRKVKANETALDKEVEKQLNNIKALGDGSLEETNRLLDEMQKLRENARKEEYDANKKARQDELKRKLDDIEKDKKGLDKKSEQYKQLEKNKLAILKEFDKESELLQKQGEDEKNKITEDTTKKRKEIYKLYYDAISSYKDKELEEDKKKQEEQLQNQKDLFKQLDQLAKFSSDYFIKQSERKVAMIDKQIDAMQKQNDFMKDLAVSGNITAQQSLAQNNKLIVEANKEKQKELKKQERIKLAMTVFDAYNSNLQSKELGGQSALVKTIKDVSLLTAFVNSLPAFFEGTEDTGANGKGLDGKGGFLSVLHPNERVVPKELNNKMGGLSNLELSTLAEDYLRGNMVNKFDTAINTNWSTEIIVSELRDLKSTIQNKPENKVEVGEILGGVMHIVETTKTSNQRVRNIRRL